MTEFLDRTRDLMSDQVGRPEAYVFWLATDPAVFTRQLMLCLIDSDRIEVVDHPESSIPLGDVVSVEVISVRPLPRHPWATRYSDIRCVRVKTHEAELELWPIDATRPNKRYDYTRAECEAFCSVVLDIQAARTPSLDRSPFVRQQVRDRKRRIDTSFDSRVNPMEYFRNGRLSSKPVWMNLVAFVLLYVGMMMAFAVFALIATALGLPGFSAGH